MAAPSLSLLTQPESNTMQRSLITLAFAAAAAGTAVSAHAADITASFSGVVQSQTDSGHAIGDTVSGSFVWDTLSASFTSFTIAGRTIGAGYTSEASMTPDGYSALFQAQISPVTGGMGNQTFTLDLEGLMPWFSTVQTDATPVLLSSALQSNLDPAYSAFSFYMANADGTGIHSLSASISQISAVPEPASWLLALVGAVGLLARRARRAR